MAYLSDQNPRFMNDSPDHQNVDLISLVIAFQELTTAKKKRELRDKILGFCYVDFDKTIRMALHYRGLPYEPGNTYYEKVFFEIYRRVFALDRFESKLRKFDTRRPFLPWLVQVTRNEVRDWLRKVDVDSGLHNYEILKIDIASELLIEEDAQTRKNNTFDMHGLLSFIGAMSGIPRAVDPEVVIACFHTCIEALSMDQQAVIYLSLIAYIPIPDRIVDYLVEETGKSRSEINAILDDLRNSLRTSTKYLDNHKKIRSLYKLYLRNLAYEKKLPDRQKELEGLADVNIASLEAEARQVRTKQEIKKIVEAKRKQLSLALKESDLDQDACLLALKKYEYIEIYVHYMNNSKTRDAIIADLNAGKLSVSSRSKQIGAIIGVPHGTIDTWRTRGKLLLLKLYRECIQRRS